MSAAGRPWFRLLGLETTPGWGAASVAAGGGGSDRGARQTARTAVAEILVPSADSPIFAGHFPGRPVLPGIAQLALVQEVLAELGFPDGAGRSHLDAAIVEVRALRLRRTIGPGDRLALRLEAAGGEADGGSNFRFDLRQLAAPSPAATAGAAGAAAGTAGATPVGEIASQGTVRIGAPGRGSNPVLPEAGQPAAHPAQSTATVLPPVADLSPVADLPPVTDLLPHAPPARLLAAVLSAGDRGIVCAGVIPASHPLADGSEVPGFMAIELAAQAAAALEALLRQRQQATRAGARIGYLVGVREARLSPTLPIDRTLRITAIPTGSAAALTTYEMEITDEAASPAESLAAGSLSTFLPDT